MPAMSRFYGIHPWEWEMLQAIERLEYLKQYEAYVRASAKS